MAWFTCMAGVGGKGNSVIVTCDADFAGIPITCTNGQKTYTKVCPSFSPYEVTFTGLVAGTWTISATVDGVVYSTTAIVTDITAVLSYGFNWQRWVDSSSSLHSSDYTDLADLLSDEAAIRQLFTEHAPTDYAASTATVTPDLATVLNNDLCAKWINLRDYALDTLYANPLIAAAMDSADKYFYGEWVITDDTTTPPTWGAKGNVPVMTANNAPYGIASASSEYASNWAAWGAFDRGGTMTNTWMSTGTTNQYIRYKSVNPICVRAIDINDTDNASYGDNVKNFRVEGSNDGVNFTPIYTGIAENNHSPSKRFTFDNDTYYLYHQIYIIDEYNANQNIKGRFQFYGRELSVSVPKMDTNTTPYGEASASAYQSNFEAYKAFDGSTSTRWNGNSDSASICYKFPQSMCVKKVSIIPLQEDNVTKAKSCVLQASDDGVLFTDIQTFETTFVANGNLTPQLFDITNNSAHKYWKLAITNTSGYINVVELQFYGLDYSEKEFEEGTTKKWLYDHGVELETIVTNTYGTGSSVTKGSQSIYLKNSSSANNSASLNAELDLSPYSLARAKIFNCLASGSVMGSIVVTATTADVNDTRIATINMNTNNGNDYALGLTSINQTYYVAMLCAASAASNPREMEVTEFWLE